MRICMKLKKLIYFVFWSLLSQFCLANCIGVVTAGGGVSFWQSVEAGALLAGKEFDIKVIVRGPKDEADTKSQELIIEQMIKMGCKGLVLAPNSKDHVNQAKDLIKNDIKVVFIDRNLDEESIHRVQTNNLLAGELAAHELIKHLEPKANIALLRLNKDVQFTSDRESGFKKTMEEAAFNIVVDSYIGINSSDAMTNAFQILKNHPEIDAVFTPNESTTVAVMQAKMRLASIKPILHIGFDSSESIKSSIEAGETLGVVVQQPYMMGYLGVQNVVNLLSGKEISMLQDTPVTFVTKENLKSFPSL